MPAPARRTLRLLAAVTGAVLAATMLPSAPAAAAPPSVYVALGDSYTAGPLIVPQSDLFTCARSSSNYVGLLARALHVTTLRDVSCSSATSAHSAPRSRAPCSARTRRSTTP